MVSFETYSHRCLRVLTGGCVTQHIDSLSAGVGSIWVQRCGLSCRHALSLRSGGRSPRALGTTRAFCGLTRQIEACGQTPQCILFARPDVLATQGRRDFNGQLDVWAVQREIFCQPKRYSLQALDIV